MATIYLASFKDGAGKTAIASGLGQWLTSQGKKVGYFKPVGFQASGKAGDDKDSAFLKQTLNLSDAVETLNPVATTHDKVASIASSSSINDIKSALAKVSSGKDSVIVEGVAGSKDIAAALNAKVILVVRYERDLNENDLLVAARTYGPSLLGVIINAVPEVSLRLAKQDTSVFLEKEGIKVLAVIPEDRAMLGLTVKDVANHLGAKVFQGEEFTNNFVESFMVGALTLDPAVDYFAQCDHKLVISRFDRPDIAWCALETSTAGLLLTSGGNPIPYVSDKAKAFDVPIITVQKDTVATAIALEDLFGKVGVHYKEKAERAKELFANHANLAAFSSSL